MDEMATINGSGRGIIPPLNTAKPERTRKEVPPPLVKHAWKPGESGNPGGRTPLFAECQRLARNASADAMRRLIELMGSEDERVGLMAADKVLERAWGKPKEQDPRTFERKFSELPPAERQAEAERIIGEAKRVLALRDERKAREAAEAAVIEGKLKDITPASEDEGHSGPPQSCPYRHRLLRERGLLPLPLW